MPTYIRGAQGIIERIEELHHRLQRQIEQEAYLAQYNPTYHASRRATIRLEAERDVVASILVDLQYATILEPAAYDALVTKLTGEATA